MCDEIMKSEGESEDRGYDADRQGAINGSPPATMNTGVADQDEKTDAEEKLGDTGKVEEPRVRENRHSCEALEGLV